MTRSNNSRKGIVRKQGKGVWKSLGHHIKRANNRSAMSELIKHDDIRFSIVELVLAPSKQECANKGYGPQDG